VTSSVDAQEDEVGYGLQVKLNSTAVIRDNVIVDTKGPGIMVYGAGETWFRAMDRDRAYYFAIEAFNEHGISVRSPCVYVK
jgi:hypothetical protein